MVDFEIDRRIALSLPPELFEKLKEYAHTRGETLSEKLKDKEYDNATQLIFDAIEDYIKKLDIDKIK